MIDGKKVVGVITEFNPFHEGHAYFLEEIRKQHSADYIVAVMSGDFVQRGEPAFMSKFQRTREALKQGVDLLIQLPILYSLSGSRDFAYGSIKILHELGFVDQLVFGSESADLERLKKMASFLLKEEENPEYQRSFKAYLAGGDSYPKAREKALAAYFPGEIRPNDNLGISYLRALSVLDSKMKVGIIQREKSFSSAHAIRRQYKEERRKEGPALAEQLSYGNMESLKDFLLYRILELQMEGTPLSSFMDVSPELADRILYFVKEEAALTGKAKTVEAFIQELKGKNYTYSRVSRALLHILLQIRKEDMEEAKKEKNPYIRVLGCSKRAEDLLRYLPENTIYRLGHSLREAPKLKDNHMMQIDLFGRRIYQAILPDTEEEFREFFLKI